MVANAATVSSSRETPAVFADHISQYTYKSWDELFSMLRQEVEDFQLRSARRRLEELTPRVTCAATVDNTDAALQKLLAV